VTEEGPPILAREIAGSLLNHKLPDPAEGATFRIGEAGTEPLGAAADIETQYRRKADSTVFQTVRHDVKTLTSTLRSLPDCTALVSAMATGVVMSFISSAFAVITGNAGAGHARFLGTDGRRDAEPRNSPVRCM
jgi:hypothetical protein